MEEKSLPRKLYKKNINGKEIILEEFADYFVVLEWKPSQNITEAKELGHFRTIEKAKEFFDLIK